MADWNYEKLETNSLDVALSALAAPGVVGASVTMPLKISVMPFLDEVTPACRAIGSCNTIMMTPGSGKVSKSKYLIGVNFSGEFSDTCTNSPRITQTVLEFEKPSGMP